MTLSNAARIDRWFDLINFLSCTRTAAPSMGLVVIWFFDNELSAVGASEVCDLGVVASLPRDLHLSWPVGFQSRTFFPMLGSEVLRIPDAFFGR